MLFNSEVPQCSPTRLSGVSFRPKSCHRFTQLHLQSLGFDLALAFPRTNTVTSRFQSEIELEVWVILKQCGRRVDKGRGEYSQQSWLHDNAGERRVSTTQKSLLIDSPALAEWDQNPEENWLQHVWGNTVHLTFYVSARLWTHTMSSRSVGSCEKHVERLRLLHCILGKICIFSLGMWNVQRNYKQL